MKNLLTFLEKYLPLVIAGVHAANTVPAASNSDKKSVVLSTVTGVADAVSQASGNPEIQSVGVLIDVAASVINALTTKTNNAEAAAAPAK